MLVRIEEESITLPTEGTTPPTISYSVSEKIINSLTTRIISLTNNLFAVHKIQLITRDGEILLNRFKHVFNSLAK
jgi:hypothetical protein